MGSTFILLINGYDIMSLFSHTELPNLDDVEVAHTVKHSLLCTNLSKSGIIKEAHDAEVCFWCAGPSKFYAMEWAGLYLFLMCLVMG